MTEIEYKLLATPDAAARIAGAPAVAEMAEGPACTRRLRSVYHDTAGGALAAAGIALRLRHDGTGWVQTVKAARSLDGGLSTAAESEIALGEGRVDLAVIPDPGLRETVAGLLGTQTLAPVFASEITRTARRLAVPGLGRVEMAIDQGEIRAGELSAPLTEIEFELMEGSPRAVFAAVRRIVQPADLRPSTLSKAARGALLAETGSILPRPEPRTARPVALSPGQTSEAAAHAVLAEALGQIGANVEAVLGSDDTEGPHQLRVGLRRLRSAAGPFAAAIGGTEFDRLMREAQWLGHEVGALRDLDVVLAELVVPEIAATPEEPGLATLADALTARAAVCRTELRATLAGERARLFLLDLAEFVACRGWLDPADWDQTARLARPVEQTAAAALDARLHKAARKARGIDDLDIEARHALRKALKTLRYGVEFFAPLYPGKAVKPFLKRLKALQDVFGDLNDAAMAAALFRAETPPGGTDPLAARAAGYLIGLRAERARHRWEAAKGLWKALKSTDPFWR